jgi:hypothetical protein
MLSWFRRKVIDAATQTQAREMKAWIGNLSQMNSDEVAAVLGMATHQRKWIEEERGADLLDPIVAYAAQPGLLMFFHGVIQSHQKSNRPMEAAGVMVWLFTLRAGANLQLRGLGRHLWRELARGIPGVEKAAMGYFHLTGVMLEIDDSERIPIGLEPERT